ncbi:MAG: TonB-dependent receptor, partial [Kangiellaceae bacterium]|nr:TonB-dependent receptor [Kangiellaceae bacterium]
MKPIFKQKRTLISTLIVLALNSSYSMAEEEADDDQDEKSNVILVTAQKRVQTLKEVPLSISVMDGEKISDAGLSSFADLSSYIPNFTVNQSPIGDKIVIRGTSSGTLAAFEQSVGTFVNGIYRGRGTQARFAFMDVERVEVLRGPQSIIFGKNTVAGALNITTALPDDDFNASVSIGYTPEFEQTEIQAMVTGPISDNLSGRIFLLSREMDKGWVNNVFYDVDGPQNDEFMGRLSLAWAVTDSTNINVMFEKSDFDFNHIGQAIIEPGPLAALGSFSSTNSSNIGNTSATTNFGSGNKMSGDSQEFSIQSETELESGTINVIAGQSKYNFARFLDADYSALDGLRFDDTDDFQQESVEIRFTSNPNDTFEYMGGLYWQQQDLKVDGLSSFNLPSLQAVLFGGCAGGVGAFGGDIGALYVPGDAATTAAGIALTLPGVPAGLLNACGTAAAFEGAPGVNRYAVLEQQTDTLGVFAQGTWHISEDLRATFGVRYTKEDKEATKATYATDFTARNTVESTNPLVIGLAQAVGEFTTHHFDKNDPGMKRSESNPSWSINLQYDTSDETMVYGGVSTGFKAGGFNSFYMNSPTRGGGAFSDDVSFEDEQVTSFELGLKTTILDGSLDLNIAAFHSNFEDLQVSIFSGNTTFQVENAAEATTKGIEADIRWRATDALSVTASFAYTDFEFDDFQTQACRSSQFVAERERLYQQAFGAGDLPGALGVVFGYNNALCSDAHINDLTGKTSAHTPEFSGSFQISHFAEFDNY